MLLIGPNNKYPAYIGELITAHPDWKQGQPLPEGWHEVKRATVPEFDRQTERLVDGQPLEINGKFEQNITVRPLNEDEKAKRDAPITVLEKLKALGLNEHEVKLLVQ